jgi:sterol desaturase/sphingolipid hydroxylase (fatty acid hydroxylase superfamily)
MFNLVVGHSQPGGVNLRASIYRDRNVRIPQSIERSLGYIIVTPSSHRIHHSQIVTETNSNYGSVFIWWDRLFGTSQSRPDPEHIQLGIADDETKELNLWQSLLLPISPAER